MNKIIYLFLFLMVSHLVDAQNIHAQKPQPIQFSGGLSISSNTYSNSVGPNRQSPFSYALSGAPSLTIYNIAFPFSFTYSDQKFSYNHPFNRYGVSPNYKWIKTHLGYRSINFSSFTLAGRQFKGVGIELTPGKFYIAALTGKLENLYAKRDSLVYGATPVDTYARRMKGAKIGFGKNSGFDIIAVKVKDQLDSAIPMIGDHIRLIPQDNIVLGVNLRLRLFKHFFLAAETAGSLHTADARATISDTLDLPDAFYKINKIIKTNLSTRWGTAGKLKADLQLKPFNLGFEYQRIDQNFKSLSIYYMVTDYQNFTTHFSTKLFRKQLRIKLKGGLQENNLSKIRRATNLRKIGSVQLSYLHPKGFSLNAIYNNMSTDQRAGYVELEDTLRLALSTTNAMLNTGYHWANTNFRHAININLGISNFKDINELYFTPIGQSTNKNTGLTYSISHKPTNMTYSLGVHAYHFASATQNSGGTGINAAIGKKMLNKKLMVRLNTSYNMRKLNNESDGYYLRIRTRLSYKITKKQRINFYFSLAKRPSISKSPLNEKRAGLTYGLNF